MNAAENINATVTTKSTAIVTAIALILCTIGISVIFVWHHPNSMARLHDAIVVMSYNTAVCLFLFGIALLGLLKNNRTVCRVCALFVLTMSSFTLIGLSGGASFNVDYWFMQYLDTLPNKPGFMSPTTALCLFLTSCSLLLLNAYKNFFKNYFILPIVFLNLMSLTVALIALLGHGIGLMPAFVWLGIKMSPHTAVGLSLFSIAIIVYIHRPAVDAFNRLNFFKRIVIGFGFMAILVVAIGSIAFMQINTVSAITHELYQNPLQIDNAAARIKSEINIINRQLKNIAIRPERVSHKDIPKSLDEAEQNIQQDMVLIRLNEPSLGKEVDDLAAGFNFWKGYVLESYALLESKDYEHYSLRTVFEGQDQVLELENILSRISLRSQQHITELNKSVESAESEAKKLVSVIVLGFLVIGVTVASLITRSLTVQLQKIRRTMLDIVHERLVTPIPYLDYTQEIGDMARALEVFQATSTVRRELETRLRQVIETMPNGIVMINDCGIIEIVNAQAEKIFGYTRSELLGKPVEHLIPKHAVQSHPHNRQSFFNNPSPRVMGAGRELFGLRRDGSEFPLEIGLAPVETNDGMKVLASIVDITERRNATIALNESRERLELTTRINQIGIWEYNLDKGELIWNDTMFEIYGRNKEYFTADYNAWIQCVHPTDIANAEKLLQDSIENMAPYSCRFRIIQPDGAIKYVHAKAKVERIGNDNQLRVLGTNIDITREELAFAKLHNLEALRSAIVEFSEDAIISKTPVGIITTWNTGARNMFGYTAEEAIGKSIVELLFPPECMQEEEMLLTQVRSGLVVKHFETVRRRKNGEVMNVSITLSPIKDSSGNFVGISTINRDISDAILNAKTLAARQKDLELSNKELERSNKELETFAYVASHDLKSPLRGIAQLSTWLEEDIAAEEYEHITSHTELLRNRIQRMEKLLDDLLIFYRAGKADGNISTVDINEMVNEIFEIQNNKPGLRLEILNPLPKLATLSTPFEQIIRNLFSNAIKHHDKEEGVIQVSSRQLDTQFIEFSVSDDGPGIPEKFHTRIYGMFQTLKPRDELEGSGMGLALIKKIVETYGGSITLKSEGRGACFSFTWPQTIRRREDHD